MGSVWLHGLLFCSDLVFYHWNRSLRAAKKLVESGTKDLEGEKRKEPEAYETQDQTFLCIMRPGVHNRDPCRKDLFLSSVLEMGIHPWRKEAAWDSKLQTTDYNVTGDAASQHQGWTNVMTSIPRVATRRSSVPERRDGKPGKAGDVEAKAEERVVKKELR